MQRVGVRQQDVEERVAGLVVGGRLLFLLGHGHAAALAAPAHLVAGFLELGLRDFVLVALGGEERGFVDDVGQFRAGVTGRAAGDEAEIDRLGDLHVAGVDMENLFATADVGQVDAHFAVETARAQQRGIEHVLAVGRGDDDDAFLRLDAVHLDEQRIERLLAFVVAAAHAGAAAAAHGVDFVDEDQAGRVLLALLEHVAHARGADADEHFHEIGAADAEEGHVGLARDGLGEQRLAGAGRADHEHALGDASAEALEPARVLEELDDFAELFLGLVDAGDVLERHLVAVAGHHARLALAEAEGALARHADLLAEEEIHQADEEDDRQEIDDQRPDDVGVVLGLDDALVAGLLDLAGEVGVELEIDRHLEGAFGASGAPGAALTASCRCR